MTQTNNESGPHNVRCPHCDFKRSANAESIHAASTIVREHLSTEHPDSTTPPQHG
jgi:hypothetical protein